MSVEPILQDLREREVAPSTLLVDQGGTLATSLVEHAKQGTQIIGPLLRVNQRAGLKPEKATDCTTLKWIGSSSVCVVRHRTPESTVGSLS